MANPIHQWKSYPEPCPIVTKSSLHSCAVLYCSDVYKPHQARQLGDLKFTVANECRINK
ncbi:hypothetical protein Fmac_013065 [Flemingia macrophylla]|uniref:Uncharacterized protein n=1 Tax=Flemingia macrophylla TaxID=520843 RepID=A0ABD1MS49_9FABA